MNNFYNKNHLLIISPTIISRSPNIVNRIKYVLGIKFYTQI